MVLTGVLTPGAAGRALDWNVLFVIAGSVGLGAIVVSSGLADLIAGGIRLASGGSELLFVIAFAVITTLMTNFITNAAAASILTPVGIAIALVTGSTLPWCSRSSGPASPSRSSTRSAIRRT